MPKLHILSPSSVARAVELTDNLITIGRTDENSIAIPDVNVSKRHGILVRNGDDYQLHDFNSTNGTFVNGERIMAVKLQDGASIHLGSVELRYESTSPKLGGSPGRAAPLGADVGLRSAASKERGMSKKLKPNFAPGKLEAGPVTLQPGFSAQPVPQKEDS